LFALVNALKVSSGGVAQADQLIWVDRLAVDDSCLQLLAPYVREAVCRMRGRSASERRSIPPKSRLKLLIRSSKRRAPALRPSTPSRMRDPFETALRAVGGRDSAFAAVRAVIRAQLPGIHIQEEYEQGRSYSHAIPNNIKYLMVAGCV
jgi:hypothetical protein